MRRRDQPDTGPPTSDEAADDGGGRVSRREVLRRAGWSGALVLGGGLLGHELIPHRHASADAADGDHYASGMIQSSSDDSVASSGLYGHDTAAPTGISEAAVMDATRPPPPDGRRGVLREFDLPVTQRQIEVGDGVVADAWSYAGRVPGPVIRATEGDTVRIHMTNRTSHAHNVHLHGRHSPEMDGWEPIPAGSEFIYEVTAEPFGLHPYHCHTAPLDEHVGRGLYGAMIVDPPEGRPDAHEFVLMLGGWDLDGDGRNELVCWNGIAGLYHRFPIKVPVGEPVRVYLLNMLEYEPIGSFHLHAQTFDVIRSGTALEPHEHTDTIALSQGERAIIEFTLPERGRYMFHPHQHHLADRGAMGWFAAI
jgi:nitrite reductase (NO-forming)